MDIDLYQDNKKIQLMKDTICKGASDEEFALFLHACQRTGLDPFMRQIWPVKRWDGVLGRESLTIQTGIDGYRLIADRTGNYAPGRETTFVYKNDALFSATAYVMKRTFDGTWHEVSGTAIYSEYVSRKKNGGPNSMWTEKAHIMLSKCAEAAALRRAFPADLSNVYTKDEMVEVPASVEPKKDEKALVTDEEVQELLLTLTACGNDYRKKVEERLDKSFGIQNFADMEKSLYVTVFNAARTQLSKMESEDV